ncbi:hypothetical protein J6590_033980 [Homalodisca vitripennis]|nr:hypothetical protein J6590_033980 [Homalodisca vitripennis]
MGRTEAQTVFPNEITSTLMFEAVTFGLSLNVARVVNKLQGAGPAAQKPTELCPGSLHRVRHAADARYGPGFVANTPRPDLPTRASMTSCSVQCDLPLDCRDQRRAETRDLVDRLKTTIEVLEAELQSLRAPRCGSGEGEGSSEWTVQTKTRHPISTKNRCDILTTEETDSPKPPNGQNKTRPNRKKKHRPRRAIKSYQPVNETYLLFSSIHIEGDSHGRGLAALVRWMVDRKTAVSGVCKPGATLLDVTSDSLPPVGSCCAIIAGNNDIATGQQNNIYKHLERRIAGKLRTARVVVATLPHRHDLPANHPITLETARVNSYIEELCVKLRGIEVPDFNLIHRKAFTPHGRHLQPQHKYLLAELLLDCVKKLDITSAAPEVPSPAATCQPPSVAPPAASPSPPPALVHTLPFDTFAEAVKSQHTANHNAPAQKTVYSHTM